MKYIVTSTFITLLLALGAACSQVPAPTETASDGIQVHGHWTVTVTNPDGSVDAVHDFDNALRTQGAFTLVDLIAGETTIKNRAIRLFSNAHGGNVAEGFSCLDGEKRTSTVQALTASVTRGGAAANAPKLTLAAVCAVSEAQTGSGITAVYTYLLRDPHVGNLADSFTTYVPDEVIPVALGQILSFNVVITFD